MSRQIPERGSVSRNNVCQPPAMKFPSPVRAELLRATSPRSAFSIGLPPFGPPTSTFPALGPLASDFRPPTPFQPITAPAKGVYQNPKPQTRNSKPNRKCPESYPIKPNQGRGRHPDSTSRVVVVSFVCSVAFCSSWSDGSREVSPHCVFDSLARRSLVEGGSNVRAVVLTQTVIIQHQSCPIVPNRRPTSKHDRPMKSEISYLKSPINRRSTGPASALRRSAFGVRCSTCFVENMHRIAQLSFSSSSSSSSTSSKNEDEDDDDLRPLRMVSTEHVRRSPFGSLASTSTLNLL